MVALILLSESAYGSLLLFDPRTHMPRLTLVMGVLFALYATLVLLVRRSHEADALLPIIILGSILFRLTLVPLGLPRQATVVADLRDDLIGSAERFRSNLFLDDDVWRYLWDGHAGAQSVNPYCCAPGDHAFDRLVAGGEHSGLWAQIRARINHSDLPTIYPPVAQGVFLAAHAIAPGSIVALKLVLIGCDLLGISIIVASLRRLRRRPIEVILYAFNPLVIVTFAGAGHIDVVMVTLLSLAAYLAFAGARRAAGIAFGLAVLVKIAPLVLLPLFLRRLGRAGTVALIATIAIISTPFILASGGGLRTFAVFARNWDFNSASFALLRFTGRAFTDNPARFARGASAVALVSMVAWIWRRTSPRDLGAFADAATCTLGALLVLSPTVMPWYATWTLGLAPLARRATTWICFSALVCLSFPMTADWKTHAGWLIVEYGALAIVALASYFERRRSTT